MTATVETVLPAGHAATRRHSLAPLTGIAFVALLVAAMAVGGETPGVDEAPAQLVDFYREEGPAQHRGSAILAVGVVFFLFFVGVLRDLMRSAGDERASAVAFGGGVVSAVGMLCWAGFAVTISEVADTATPEAIQALHALNTSFFIVGAGQAALLIATGVAGVRSRRLPAWMAWTALGLGVASVTPAGFFAFVAFLLWTVIASVLLWRRGE